MLLYINDDTVPPQVFTMYPDATPDKRAFHPGVTRIMQVPDDTALTRIGDPPTIPGASDTRPYAVPSTDLTAYAASSLQAKFAAGEIFNVATSGAAALNILCDGINDTRADLALLALYGQTNPTGTRMWIDNNGVPTSLTGAQFVTLATLAGTWVSDCYPALASVLKGIRAGTVKTPSDVDAAFAAVTA